LYERNFRKKINDFGFSALELQNLSKKIFQKKIIYSLKKICSDRSNNSIDTLEKYLSFNKKHEIDIFFNLSGNQLLLSILDSCEESDEDVCLTVKKMEILLRYGAFMPWQKDAVKIVDKTENLNAKAKDIELACKAFLLHLTFKEKYNAYMRDYNEEILGILINNKAIGKKACYKYTNLYKLF